MSETGRRRIGRTIAVGIMLSVVFAAPASAQDDAVEGDAEDLVVLTGGLRVLDGETVATAVSFNGPVTIEGTVTQTLVVFNGRTEISGTVREDVVVFNGSVVVRSGAEVGGDVVSRQTPRIEDGATVRGDTQGIANRFDFENIGFAGRIAWWIGYSVSTLVLGLFLLLVAPGLDGAILGAVGRRLGASIGLGVAVFFLVPIAGVILLVTIVGIPLGLFVLLALALLYTVGYVAGAHAVGRLLIKPPRSRFGAFLAGWGILRLVGLVPILGGLVWLAAAILGLGVLTVAARRGPTMVETSSGPLPPAPVVA